MDRAGFLELLDTDGQLLRRVADEDLTAEVPPCPGWAARGASVGVGTRISGDPLAARRLRDRLVLATQ